MSPGRARASRFRVGLPFAFALLAAATDAFATPLVEVGLGAECPPLSAAQIGSLSELDLKDEARLERVTVRIECRGPVIDVRAQSSPDQAEYERTLSARLLEQAGAERTIAVTVSQMILADRFRLETPPRAAPAPAPPASAPPIPRREPSPAMKRASERIQGDFGLLRRGAAHGFVSTTIGAGVALRLTRPLWLEAHGAYERADVRRSLGHVTASVLWLRFGPALMIERGRLELHGAALLSIGQATLTGHALTGNRDDAVSGVSGSADVGLGPTLTLGPLALSARALVGYALRAPIARARGDADVSLGGAYFGGLLSLGFTLAR